MKTKFEQLVDVIEKIRKDFDNSATPDDNNSDYGYNDALLDIEAPMKRIKEEKCPLE